MLVKKLEFFFLFLIQNIYNSANDGASKTEETSESKKIVDLNYDVLYETLNLLGIDDLENLGETHEQFTQIYQDLFLKKYL